MTLTSLYNNEARDLALWKTEMPNEPGSITNLVLVESDHLTKFTAGELNGIWGGDLVDLLKIIHHFEARILACLESQDRDILSLDIDDILDYREFNTDENDTLDYQESDIDWEENYKEYCEEYIQPPPSLNEVIIESTTLNIEEKTLEHPRVLKKTHLLWSLISKMITLAI
ncbi:hypothetical protein C1646_814458 [Rhizophagus diaphanus]|nr:hypothetical protein C1646_814458 [Rhizophagus diaphanus] [Rhizophagus sp. MUCL 43196]